MMPNTKTNAFQAGVQPRRFDLRKTAFLLLRVGIGAGMLVYLARSSQINFAALLRIFAAWPVTLVAVSLMLLDIWIMSVRVSLLFRSARLSLSWWNSFQLNLIGFLFSTFLPGAAGGDIAKVVYATKENRGGRAEVATVLILDRLVGLFSLVLLPLLFAPFFPELLRTVAVVRRLLYLDGLLAAGMAAGAMLVMFFRPTRAWTSWILGRWPGVRSLALRVLDALATHGQARGTLLGALVLSVLANAVLVVVTGLGLYAVSPASFSMKLALVAPIGHLVNSLPLTPGGIGVGEAAFNVLFALTGMRGGAETLLCMRLWNVPVGLLGLLTYLIGMGRIVHPYKDKEASESTGDESKEAQSEYLGAEPVH